MRRTSVMLEFSDEVYDSLVEPLKKNKRFSKLLAALVEGYISDSYIRDFIDGTLEDRKRAVVSSFSQSIDNMSDSLMSMGLFTDELEALSMGGQNKFSQRADRQSQEIGGYVKESTDGSNETVNNCRENDGVSEEIKNINNRIDSLQDSVNTALEKIMKMISSNSQGNVVIPTMMGMPPMMQVSPQMAVGYYPQIQQPVNDNSPYDTRSVTDGTKISEKTEKEEIKPANPAGVSVIHEESSAGINSSEHISDFVSTENYDSNEDPNGDSNDDLFISSLMEDNSFEF